MRLHRKWKPLEVRYERYGMMGDIQYLQELQQRENYRFKITEVAGRQKKNDRIRRLLPLFRAAQVLFPRVMHYTDSQGHTAGPSAYLHRGRAWWHSLRAPR